MHVCVYEFEYVRVCVCICFLILCLFLCLFYFSLACELNMKENFFQSVYMYECIYVYIRVYTCICMVVCICLQILCLFLCFFAFPLAVVCVSLRTGVWDNILCVCSYKGETFHFEYLFKESLSLSFFLSLSFSDDCSSLFSICSSFSFSLSLSLEVVAVLNVFRWFDFVCFFRQVCVRKII